MMEETKDKEVQEFIKKKIESANWFKNFWNLSEEK